MARYNRFFIVGLLPIELAGVYAANHEALSAQQSNKRENLKAAFDESILTIENAAAGSAAEDAPRVLKKRSDPNRHRGTPKDEPDSPRPEDIQKLRKESAELAAAARRYQLQQEKAARRTLRQSKQAIRPQEQASRTKASKSGPSQNGRNPGPSRH